MPYIKNSIISTTLCFIIFVASHAYIKTVEYEHYFEENIDYIRDRVSILSGSATFISGLLEMPDKALNRYSNDHSSDIHMYPYSLGSTQEGLTKNEKHIISLLSGYIKDSGLTIPKNVNNIFYRSYEGNGKYIFFNPQNEFFIPKQNIQREYCVINQLCTKYALNDDLADGVLVSTIYKDMVTGKDAFRYSFPVYVNNEIVGDMVFDVYIVRNNLNSLGLQYSNVSLGNSNVLFFSSANEPFESLSYNWFYHLDDNLVIILEYPIIDSVIKITMISPLLLLINLALVRLFMNMKYTRKAQRKAAELSYVDVLTDLHNRRVMEEENFINDTRDKPAAVIAIDGDRIKSINDKFGHHVGDEAIKHIALSMKKTFRTSDYLIRTGGDEFLVVLPNCTLSSRVLELIHQLKKEVSENTLFRNDIQLSISAGFAFKLPMDRVESAIILADEELYKDKHGTSNDSKLY